MVNNSGFNVGKKITLILVVWVSNFGFAEQLRVAVASNFIKPMESIVANFEKQSGHRVVVSYGSSGKHYAQIVHGAPFDLFLSADQHKPLELEKKELTIKNSRATYAIGTLVLWSANPSFIDDSSKVLLDQNFQNLAFANPKLAPYGQAALQVLEKLELVESTQNRWVLGENISQTFQFVNSRNAELGFVAASQVFESGVLKSGSAWVIPKEYYQPIKQEMVLLKRAQNNEAAAQLYQFILDTNSQKLIRLYGYQ